MTMGAATENMIGTATKIHINLNVITLYVIMRSKPVEKRKYTTITIPAPLFQRIQEKIKSTGFSSVSDYATYVLRETMSEMAMMSSGKRGTKGVLEKLKALGYA